MSLTSLRNALLALTLSTGLVTLVRAQHEDVVRPAEWKDLALRRTFHGSL